ncbi:MAG TPA: PilX N-terminal domain-containing pilus assembly protein [Gammaproteobacteria bacterium]|nr:PilX N-terminal domain-containing pilus assembly protein [Gammaproteobacteria bacterium]
MSGRAQRGNVLALGLLMLTLLSLLGVTAAGMAALEWRMAAASARRARALEKAEIAILDALEGGSLLAGARGAGGTPVTRSYDGIPVRARYLGSRPTAGGAPAEYYELSAGIRPGPIVVQGVRRSAAGTWQPVYWYER